MYRNGRETEVYEILRDQKSGLEPAR